MGVSENRGTRFDVLGVPLKGFYSIWGIEGAPLFWEMPIRRKCQKGGKH